MEGGGRGVVGVDGGWIRGGMGVARVRGGGRVVAVRSGLVGLGALVVLELREM